jgi:hypothetical protein
MDTLTIFFEQMSLTFAIKQQSPTVEILWLKFQLWLQKLYTCNEVIGHARQFF